MTGNEFVVQACLALATSEFPVAVIERVETMAEALFERGYLSSPPIPLPDAAPDAAKEEK